MKYEDQLHILIVETPGERGPTTSTTDLDVQVCIC